jgi:hypothetical protein
MLAKKVAARCAEETGASRLSTHAEEVALIAIAHADRNLKAWRRTIRSEFRTRHPEFGSILLMILIPIIINLISAWLAKWIFKEPNLGQMQQEAISALKS